MNVPYTNTHYRRFLRRYITKTAEFAERYHYNHRNMRRWLFSTNFPRPPQIALLCKQIAEYRGIPLIEVQTACNNALLEDMQDFITSNV